MRARRSCAGKGGGVFLDAQDVVISRDSPRVGVRIEIDRRVVPHPFPGFVGLGGIPTTVEKVDVVAAWVVRSTGRHHVIVQDHGMLTQVWGLFVPSAGTNLGLVCDIPPTTYCGI